MRILLPTGSFFPDNSGGPSITLYWLTKALANRGIDCYVITDSANLRNNRNLVFNKWINLDGVNVNYTLNRLHQFPFKMLYHSIKMISKVEIIVLTSIFYFPSFLLSIIAIIKRKPIIWSVRGELDPEAIKFNYNIKKLILSFVNTFYKEKIIFHVTCEAEQGYVKKVFGSSVETIKIPNYMFLLSNSNTNIQIKTISKYLLYIGRIHEKKAIDNLIIALTESELFLKNNIELIIAGDYKNKYGQLLKRIIKKNNLEERIRFLGHVDSTTKQKLYTNAYFTIMPSHTENFGNVVIESLSCGTPVIASHGTPWKKLEQYEAGFWIDNSPASIAKTLDKIIAMPQVTYQQYRKNAFKLVSEEFDIEQNIDKWIDVFKKITNE